MQSRHAIKGVSGEGLMRPQIGDMVVCVGEGTGLSHALLAQ
jgi:hypothetical protein